MLYLTLSIINIYLLWTPNRVKLWLKHALLSEQTRTHYPNLLLRMQFWYKDNIEAWSTATYIIAQDYHQSCRQGLLAIHFEDGLAVTSHSMPSFLHTAVLKHHFSHIHLSAVDNLDLLSRSKGQRLLIIIHNSPFCMCNRDGEDRVVHLLPLSLCNGWNLSGCLRNLSE